MADRMIFFKESRTGGGATSMDAIDGLARGDLDPDTGDPVPLQDVDVCFVAESGNFYIYVGDIDSAGVDDGDLIIAPLTNAGDFRWLRYAINPTAAQIAALITGATAIAPLDADEFSFYKAVGGVLRKVTWSNIKATLKTYFDSLYPTSTTVRTIVKCTQAEYDLLSPPDTNTLYIIVG